MRLSAILIATSLFFSQSVIAQDQNEMYASLVERVIVEDEDAANVKQPMMSDPRLVSRSCKKHSDCPAGYVCCGQTRLTCETNACEK